MQGNSNPNPTSNPTTSNSSSNSNSNSSSNSNSNSNFNPKGTLPREQTGWHFSRHVPRTGEKSRGEGVHYQSNRVIRVGFWYSLQTCFCIMCFGWFRIMCFGCFRMCLWYEFRMCFWYEFRMCFWCVSVIVISYQSL